MGGVPIGDEEFVYRRLPTKNPNWVYTDPITGERRPTSGAFMPDSDGVSVYQEQVLVSHGLTAAHVVKAPENLIVSLGVADIRSVVTKREVALDVEADAWPFGESAEAPRRDVAHALIIGWTGLSNSQRRASQLGLANVPSLSFIYP